MFAYAKSVRRYERSVQHTVSYGGAVFVRLECRRAAVDASRMAAT